MAIKDNEILKEFQAFNFINYCYKNKMDVKK
jgi:hypothetical protein